MKKLCLAVMAVALGGVLAVAQTAQITLWPVPTPSSLPADLSFSSDGMVFFSEFAGEKIGKLDPQANTIAERDVGASPLGIWVEGQQMIYFTLPLDDALRAVVFTSGEAGWNLPTVGGWPATLVPAPSGPGVVNLWLNERLAGKVARFSPSQVAVTLPLFQFPPQPVSPDVLEVEPVVTPVVPEFHPGNPALPPPIALLPSAASGPFTEWTAFDPTNTVEDLAVAPDGMVWFTQPGSPLSRLDPGSDTVLLYGLPAGTNALGVEVGPGGKVWFTDTTRPAIGRLDPATGNVTLWPIPGGVQPIEVAVDAPSGVWFADREGNAIGFLSPARDEISLWRLPPGSYPVTVKLGPDGAVWFVCERGNTIGRLEIIPVLGPPPVGPGTTTGCNFLSYSAFQSGRRARVQLTYHYDGAYGLPAWVTAVPTIGGSDAPHFDHTEVAVTAAGIGSAQVEITYTGAGLLETDGLRLYMYSAAGIFCERVIDFRAIWGP
jgi:streptogramin lyase